MIHFISYYSETPAFQVRRSETTRLESKESNFRLITPTLKATHGLYVHYKRRSDYLFPTLFWTRSFIRPCEACLAFVDLLFSGLSEPAMDVLP